MRHGEMTNKDDICCLAQNDIACGDSCIHHYLSNTGVIVRSQQ